MKRIADALERQNIIRVTELRELHNIVVPELGRDWKKEERETEVIYGEQPVSDEDEAAEWSVPNHE
tara:strand:+ start:1903 stop:2100 length:198 start_codon:yes stop_codon:yes gene_type:complete